MAISSPGLQPVTAESTFMLWFLNIHDKCQVSNRNHNQKLAKSSSSIKKKFSKRNHDLNNASKTGNQLKLSQKLILKRKDPGLNFRRGWGILPRAFFPSLVFTQQFCYSNFYDRSSWNTHSTYSQIPLNSLPNKKHLRTVLTWTVLLCRPYFSSFK